LPRERQLLGPVHDGHVHGEDVAPDARPGQAGHRTHAAAGVGGAHVLEFCDLMWNDGVGIYGTSDDLEIIGCDVGKSGLENIIAGGGNSVILGGKSWGAGQITAANGDGLHMSGGRFRVFAWTAQDNVHDGLSVQSDAQGNESNIVACILDSNGTPAAPRYGIWFWNGIRISIVGGACLDRRVGAARGQWAGIGMDGGLSSDISLHGVRFHNNLTEPVTLGGSFPAGALTARDNPGYVTENSGTSSGTGAQQTIAHGLARTPTRVYLSTIEDAANAYQSAPADATNIYIAAVSGKDYVWKAEVV